MEMSLTNINKRGKPMEERYEYVISRSRNRQKFLELLIKLMGACELGGLRLIVENPWSMQTYLKNGFIKPPALVDNDRSRRGDYFKKETAYWFINCEPTQLETLQKDKQVKRIVDTPSNSTAGLCSEARSMISHDYARNFICDFILGKPQVNTQLTLF